MVQEWWPEAKRRPGLPSKAGYFLGLTWPKTGDVKHSAEGYWPGIHSVLDDPNRRASWHFTIGYDRVEQHYPVSMNCWHGGDVDNDGGVRANIDCVGIEHLGVAGTPLTPYQIEMTAKLTDWLMDQHGIQTYTRRTNGTGWRILEHNEVSDVPTSCPSGRIQWNAIEAYLLRGEDERVKYTDPVLDAVFLEFYKALGRHGALIDALGHGLAAVAQTVATLATKSGDAPQSVYAEIERLDEEITKVRILHEEFARKAIEAYEVLNGGQS